MCVHTYVWRVEHNSQKLVLSLHYVGPRITLKSSDLQQVPLSSEPSQQPTGAHLDRRDREMGAVVHPVVPASQVEEEGWKVRDQYERL